MSWYRKVKSLYSMSLVTISFIIWSTLSKLLLKNPVDYKLFLITLSIVFFTQYLSNKKLKNMFMILVPSVVSMLVSFICFKEQAIFINLIFLLFMILLTYSLKDANINHSQYRNDIRKSMGVLAFIWLISFALGADFVNTMYRFHILYIIMIVILMRETRRYVYSVKNNTSMATNIIIGISVLSLSLDYANKVFAQLFHMIAKILSFILFIIVSILTRIFAGPVARLSEQLRKLILKRKAFIPAQGVDGQPKKQPIIPEYKGIELPPVLILVFKVLILLLILYAIYKFLSRFRDKTKIYTGFIEEKERIVRKKNKTHWVKDLFGKIFEGSKNNRDKILYTYKGFEKITEEAEIYKSYMTATQLKNVTKINVDNVDNLEEMTRVYNEAKFSTHDMTEEQVEQVKKGHSNIKKQL